MKNKFRLFIEGVVSEGNYNGDLYENGDISSNQGLMREDQMMDEYGDTVEPIVIKETSKVDRFPFVCAICDKIMDVRPYRRYN